MMAHKLTLLRDKRTSARDFRRLIKELTFYLGCVIPFGVMDDDDVDDELLLFFFFFNAY